MFLVVLFLAKRTNFFERTVIFVRGGNQAELIYGNSTVADLVNKDSDGDGIPDWEEPLWGLDPTKKETTPGVPDSTVIAKLKLQNEYNLDSTNGTTPAEENLTETDKFSRELFSSVAALNQNGAMDQTTANKISDSLSEKIKSSAPRKIYTISDINVVNNDLFKTIKNYNDNLNNAYKKNQLDYGVLDVFKKFIIDDNNVDTTALLQLDPIIEKLSNIKNIMIEIEVPQSLSELHLSLLNELEQVIENIKDIRQYDTDPILSLRGISKYDENTKILQDTLQKLADTINQKLNN